MVYGEANYINEKGLICGRFPAAQTDYRRLRQGYVHIPQQAAFFRADLWRLVGPLDPSFYFAMDYDLWVRISRHAALAFLPGRVWANFRLHASSKTFSSGDLCWPEMMRVHYREGGSWLSLINAKYVLRRALAPLVRLRLHRRLSG